MKLNRYITPGYIKLQQELHDLPKGYGGGGGKWAQATLDLMRKYECETVLDYGCGQGLLREAIKNHLPKGAVFEYDPAIRGKEIPPRPVDLVVCTDVLEHIEPDRRGVVVDHLFKLAKKVLFVVVATRPSKKWMSDGRNAHLIIEPASWWKERVTFPGFQFDEAPTSPLEVTSREWIAVLVRQ